MDLKQKRKEFIEKQPWYYKVLVFLNAVKIWYEEDKLYPSHPVKCQVANIYSPILWIVVIVGLPCVILALVINTVIGYCLDIKTAFTIKRTTAC